MSSLFKQFKMDADKESNGVRIEYGANDDGTTPTFIVRRRGPSNQRYATELQRAIEPHKRKMELGTLDQMISRHILMKVFCSAVLVGWEHVLDEQNQPIPFSSQTALVLFDKLPELYDDLLEQSAKVSLFRSDEQEVTAKN